LEGGVVAIFLERLARGEETTIFGDGTQSRDFAYVDDVIAAMLATVGKTGGPYNVGTGEDTTVSQLHDACAKVAGVAATPQFEDARLGDVQRSVLDVALIERELGWRAQVRLDDGLRRTWAWMQDHGSA
ncbi:MAG TPA: GDP-mannose 4,6-dehydratase, partial [Gaiellaceae bacterium]|nr:GDP-mannose 4,6-dehydratase [Gaiellaceae bacterium]